VGRGREKRREEDRGGDEGRGGEGRGELPLEVDMEVDPSEELLGVTRSVRPASQPSPRKHPAR
jgi:hypothetical protein